MADHVDPSLAMRPNIILIHAGTNDMNSDSIVSTEGTDPESAAQRLGSLIDQMVSACPDATILVAMIINVISTGNCSSYQAQEARTQEYQSLIPGIVKSRAAAGKHVLAVDFSKYSTSLVHTDDCIHPTNAGYKVMGDYWYDFIHQIPTSWINAPVGADPSLPNITASESASAQMSLAASASSSAQMSLTASASASAKKSQTASASTSTQMGLIASNDSTHLKACWLNMILPWIIWALLL
jgi:hypothetical protein